VRSQRDRQRAQARWLRWLSGFAVQGLRRFRWLLRPVPGWRVPACRVRVVELLNSWGLLAKKFVLCRGRILVKTLVRFSFRRSVCLCGRQGNAPYNQSRSKVKVVSALARICQCILAMKCVQANWGHRLCASNKQAFQSDNALKKLRHWAFEPCPVPGRGVAQGAETGTKRRFQNERKQKKRQEYIFIFECQISMGWTSEASLCNRACMRRCFNAWQKNRASGKMPHNRPQRRRSDPGSDAKRAMRLPWRYALFPFESGRI